MDPLFHTLLAVGCMLGSFYLGRYLAEKECFEPICGGLLEKLDTEGLIYTVTDKDGQKELVPVSEVVAKALRDVTPT